MFDAVLVRNAVKNAKLLLIVPALLSFGCDALWAQAVDVPLDSGWVLSQRNFKIPEERTPERNAEMVEFLGRRSFRLARGLAYVPGLQFDNGTIDLDMATDATGRFIGIAFRVQSDDNYEVIFLRPGASGTDQAVQYTPGLNGANGWQIFTGPGHIAVAEIPRNKWFHVRIVVAGLVAKLYLNNATEPVLTVPQLRSGNRGGSIGFWGHLGAAYYSNLRITRDSASYPSAAPQNFVAGALTDWQLSKVFTAAQLNPEKYPDVRGMQWEKVQAENPGMVVINRYRRSPNVWVPEPEERSQRPPASEFVFARTVIAAERDQIAKMKIAYSDEAIVFVNGTPVYEGKNTMTYRQGNFLGLLNQNNDAVYLPLKKGDNEVLLAVTEYFGGWAFLCQLVR